MTHSEKHPTESELAEFLGGALPPRERERLIAHMGSCRECLAKVVAADEAVAGYLGETRSAKRGAALTRSINLYLVGSVAAFACSFLEPRYFIQFLVAAVVLALKWIIDSKTTKTLITIHEAWKKSGLKETSKIKE